MVAAKPPKVPKSQLTKSKIIRSFLSLMDNQKWDKIAVKSICNKTNITRGTFYQYFNDIYDLMEQIELPLLEELTKLYQTHQYSLQSMPSSDFFEHFDYAPPTQLVDWFQFCKKHRKELQHLLSSNGNPYFLFKLKGILQTQIEHMMDADKMPHDALRVPFEKAFLELHFLAARTWLYAGDDDFLSVEEIINILNTMRVGANYLSNRRQNSPDFERKMHISDGTS